MYPKRAITLLILFTLLIPFLHSEDTSINKEPETLAELETAIEKILKNKNVPAAGIAMIAPDGTEWIKAFGKADPDKNIPATRKTMFRLGSVSKMFVSLAILKLAEEGHLTLKDRVKDLVPDVPFNNPWEKDYPVRVEHLLEHTTGWTFWKLAEFASDDSKPLTLKEALYYRPSSRTSQWIPGTRFLYSNSGPAVAAYIVEKITGLKYEEYIQLNFFKPMKTETMCFLPAPHYMKNRAQLYENGQKRSYMHLLMRPSGALNASPENMLEMVRFFINRGVVSKETIIKESSLERMERCESLPTSGSGMTLYGLGNYPTPYKSFDYRTHTGGIPGACADFSYLPARKTGYAVMLSNTSYSALNQITALIRYFQTKNLKALPPEPDSESYASGHDISGYYATVNPMFKLLTPFLRFHSLQKIRQEGGKIYKSNFIGNNKTEFIPEKNNRYRSVETGRIEMVMVDDPLAGKVLHVDGVNVLEKVSPIPFYIGLVVSITWFIFLISTVLTAIIRVILYYRKRCNKTSLSVSLLPFYTSLCIYISFIPFFLTGGSDYELFKMMGTVNISSMIIMLSTLAFGLMSAWSLIYILRNRKHDNSKLFYWHSLSAAVFHVIVAVFFLFNGFIALQIWHH